LAIVYSAVLAGWGYLIAEGIVKVSGMQSSSIASILEISVPLVIFALFVWQLHRYDEATDEPAALSEDSVNIIYSE
jgi:hypothetical protein